MVAKYETKVSDVNRAKCNLLVENPLKKTFIMAKYFIIATFNKFGVFLSADFHICNIWTLPKKSPQEEHLKFHGHAMFMMIVIFIAIIIVININIIMIST